MNCSPDVTDSGPVAATGKPVLRESVNGVSGAVACNAAVHTAPKDRNATTIFLGQATPNSLLTDPAVTACSVRRDGFSFAPFHEGRYDR